MRRGIPFLISTAMMAQIAININWWFRSGALTLSIDNVRELIGDPLVSLYSVGNSSGNDSYGMIAIPGAQERSPFEEMMSKLSKNTTLWVSTSPTNGAEEPITHQQKQIKSNTTMDFFLSRHERFPTIGERSRYYMGYWYEPCYQHSTTYRRDADTVALYNENYSTIPMLVSSNISKTGIFWLNFPTIRKTAASNYGSGLGQIAQDLADAILPYVDLQDWKYNPNANPLLVQLSSKPQSDTEEAALPLPYITPRRQSSSADQSIRCSSPIRSPMLWDMYNKNLLSTLWTVDLNWTDKLDMTVFQIPAANYVEREDCLRDPRCRIVMNVTAYPRIEARALITSDQPTIFKRNQVRRRIPKRKYYLQYKAIVVSPSDTDMMTWSLFSKSVVIMQPPTRVSWTMEDQLEPWVHYVPLAADFSNMDDRVNWVLDNPARAQKIAQRATLWINDLYFHEKAAEEKEIILADMLKRYQAHFKKDETSPPAVKISNMVKKSRVFRAGGRTKEELIQKSKLSIAEDTKYRLKTAVCYKSLFGAADLDRFIQWAVYNNRLGFDRVFVWYLSSVKEYAGFDTLSQLPFVTLIENEEGVVKEVRPGYDRVQGRLDQRALEKICLTDVAKDYDWVMFADSDEYLWFNEELGLKQFLSKHASNYNYVSFGKYMYTRNYGVDIPDSGLGLDMYPFTTGRYCFAKPTYSRERRNQYLGQPVCPVHYGRSKVIVRPQFHDRVNVHGSHWPDPSKGSKQFHSDVAHFKEWPGIFSPVNTTVVAAADFVVREDAELGLHHQSLDRAHLSNLDGTYNITYDSGLHAWFEFVVNRGDSTAVA